MPVATPLVDSPFPPAESPQQSTHVEQAGTVSTEARRKSDVSVDSVRRDRNPNPTPTETQTASSADPATGRAQRRIPTSSRCDSPDQRHPQRPTGPEPGHTRVVGFAFGVRRTT